MTVFSRERVDQVIEKSYAPHLARLQELVRQPSVSPENRGVRDCAALVQRYFVELGCRDARLVETRGNPVVFGRFDSGADKTVIVYMMYDTMPADEPGWTVDPWAGTVKELPGLGPCLVARGAFNTKGELAAFVNACHAIVESGQAPPVNLLFVAEGEEELGSRHLIDFIRAYQRQLEEARVVYFPFADQNRRGKVINHLGVKGIVYFELEVNGRAWGYGPRAYDIHGSNKAWVDSPAWRVVQALGSMVTPDGNRVLIDGFYENVRQPPPEDEELLAQLERTFDEEAAKETMHVQRFINDEHGVPALRRYLYSPTLNINGIWSGYTGPETKTVLPWKATAKVDVRLVPDMKVEDVVPQIRRHLDQHGFREVQIRLMESGYGWAKTNVRTPAAQALHRTFREFGYEPEVWPTLAGSAPFALFNRDPLHLPFIDGGLGHGANAHAPDEYLVVGEGGPCAGLLTMEKFYVALLDNLSRLA